MKSLVVLAKPWFSVAHLRHLTYIVNFLTGFKKCALSLDDIQGKKFQPVTNRGVVSLCAVSQFYIPDQVIVNKQLFQKEIVFSFRIGER